MDQTHIKFKSVAIRTRSLEVFKGKSSSGISYCINGLQQGLIDHARELRAEDTCFLVSIYQSGVYIILVSINYSCIMSY